MQHSTTKRFLSLLLTVMLVISMVTVTAVSTSAADTDVAPEGASAYYLAGDMNSWSATATPMTQATDTAGTTIFYAGPYSSQYQFKVTSASGEWYGSEIKTKDIYDSSIDVYEYGATGNCWPAAASSYYVVFTTSAGGNAISCVTSLPISGGGGGGSVADYAPTIYVKDDTNSGCAVWAWTAEDKNLFSSSWDNRPTTAGKTVNEDGYYEFKANNKISLSKQYSVKLTRGTSTSSTTSWFETIAHGDIYITINADGKAVYSSNNPVADTRTKDTAFKEGLWIDPQPENVEDCSALIRWYEKSSGEYRLYLPSGLDLSTVTVYHTYSNLSIDGNKVESGSTISLSKDADHKISGDVSGNLKAYQSANVSTMYIGSLSDLPDETSSSLQSKENVVVESGSIYCADENGAITLTDSLKKIKGRGNSSWEASYKLYGKYAFNLTLKNKTNALTGGKVKTKKYSMLANNMDEAMLRNKLVYDLAADIGLDYSPVIRVYDVYNNGRYLGSYTICEKVEVGSSGLLSGVSSLDDANEEVNPDIANAPQRESGSRGSAGYYRYVDSTDPEDITGGYLLELEFSERFYDEISGFISNKGQCVVVKYPELATKNEVSYIKNLFNQAESAIYSSSADINQISKYIDVESFAKMYLVQELTKNVDACQTSYYIYKESDLTGDGKLHASPVWDYDWTSGQYEQDRPVASGTNSTSKMNTTTGYNAKFRYIDNNSSKGVNIQAKLCECSAYWNLVKSVWYTNFKGNLSNYVFDDSQYTILTSPAKITQYYNKYLASIKMNEKRYGFIASNPSKAWGTADTGSTPEQTIDYLNDWLFDRSVWLNSNIGSKATSSKPSLTVALSDDEGAIAQTGTQEKPEVVSSDVTLKISTDANALTTLKVNGKKVYPNSSGEYEIALKEDTATEISYAVTSRKPAVASTDTDYVATKSATMYVVKDSEKALHYGDADLDQVVSVMDATLIQRYIAKFDDKLSANALLCCDADGNGMIDIRDCTNIQRYLAGLSCSEKVGTEIIK